jgi:hypothetical protein
MGLMATHWAAAPTIAADRKKLSPDSWNQPTFSVINGIAITPDEWHNSYLYSEENPGFIARGLKNQDTGVICR